MSGWLIDFLPPQARNSAAIIALAAATIGLIVAFAGVRIAKAAVILLTACLASAAAALYLPALGLSPISSAIAGFAIGALAGALGFRILQGLTLAVCLGLAVAGAYYRFRVLPPPPATLAAASQISASDLLIKGPLAGTRPAAPHHPQPTFAESLAARWNDIPAKHQTRMEIAAIGTAAAVLIFAFAFSRITTWLATALIGAAMTLAGAELAVHVYAPQSEGLFQSRLHWYGALTLLTLAGLAVQRFILWPKTPQPKSKMARGIDIVAPDPGTAPKTPLPRPKSPPGRGMGKPNP